MSIMEAMESTGVDCLPSSGGVKETGNKAKIPGWKEHVGPYLEDSNFWYKVWLSAGKPDAGSIFQNMKSSKKKLGKLEEHLQHSAAELMTK